MNQIKSFLFTRCDKLLFSFILYLGLFNVAIHADSDDSFTRKFIVGDGGKLIIDVERASINIKGIEGNEVNVTVSWKTYSPFVNHDIINKYKLKFDQSGNDVSIQLLDKNTLVSFLSRIAQGAAKITFDITVPEKYNIDVSTSGRRIYIGSLQGNVKTRTSGGSISFETIDGSINGKTSGGSISLEHCTKDVHFETSGGRITIGSVNGSVYAKTSGGSIEAEECGAEVSAYTSGGAITLEKVMSSVDASTSGGSISVELSAQPEKDCMLKTSGGSITIALPKDIKTNVNAQTSGGRVKTDFQVTTQGELKSNRLIATINGGGPLLSLKTSGGSIHILKADR